MLKKVLLIALISMLAPAIGAELKSLDEMVNKQDTLLYVYTPWCGACKVFNPMYEYLQKKYGNNYCFLKINADTPYGGQIVRRYNIKFVPYVALFRKQSKPEIISDKCKYDFDCMEKLLSKQVRS